MDEDEDEDLIQPTNRKGRALKRRKTVINDEDDFSEGAEAEVVDEGRALSNLF